MKKLFCIFAVFVFLPCSVPAAEDTDMIKPFQIAKSYKYGQMEKQDFYSERQILNNKYEKTESEIQKRGASLRSCPAGKYKKNESCVPYCDGISCTAGNPVNTKNGCCCQ